MVSVPVISEGQKAQQNWARIPVPWGQEVKAQFASDRKRKKFSWRAEPKSVPKILNLEGRDADFPVLYKNLASSPLPRAKGKSLELPVSLAKWAIANGIFKDEVLARRLRSLVSSVYRPQAWAEQIPPSLQAWATQRGAKRRKGERPKALDPFSTRLRVSSLDRETQEWANQAPPSLLEWATAKGIKRTPVERTTPLDPFKTRTRVVSLERRRQVAAALKRGEWCRVSDLDVLPSALREWLLERCSFIRWVGSGRVSGTPVNGYVTEDGLIFYVAEDGSTFYVQET